MPSTISYNFGDVVLVPFPFTDQTTIKKRPAVVVSSSVYHRQRHDLILMPITSQIATRSIFGEVVLIHWKEAGLPKPSVIKPILTTIEKGLVIRRLGTLQPKDIGATQEALRIIIGERVI
jgi:mRNA interferase MazF